MSTVSCLGRTRLELQGRISTIARPRPLDFDEDHLTLDDHLTEVTNVFHGLRFEYACNDEGCWRMGGSSRWRSSSNRSMHFSASGPCRCQCELRLEAGTQIFRPGT